ncbi:MAG: cytochrome c biogenesis CcdA family protein [Acidimicrobiia bacterium]
MNSTQLAYAFTLGMVSTVNPCGFAMLPAYLSYFLGLEDAPEKTSAGVLRALAVGLAVTAGFVGVFGVIGLAITQLSLSINNHLAWVTLAIGVGLVALGIAMLLGFELSVRLPMVQMGTGSRELSSMFLFGISYAIASLSCTLPLFLPVMANAFEANNLATGVTTFVVYAAGMGLILSAVTMALALAKGGLVKRLRSLQAYVNKISGVLLVIAGLYLTYYGYWEVRVLADPLNPPPSGPVDFVTNLSANFKELITNVGGLRLAIVLGAVVAIALVITIGTKSPSTPEKTNTEA